MNKVQHHYNEIAEVYDRQYNYDRGRIYYSHICKCVMENLPKEGSLLDLGCGTGLFMERYLKNGKEAVGLDISRGMIIRARERCRGHDVMEATAEVLPFKDNTFDAVSSLLAFSYLQQPEEMLRESYRVLKPGGAISICTLGKNVFTSMVPAVYRIGEKIGVQRVGMAAFGEHYYTEPEINGIFEEVGFEEIHVNRRSFAHVDLNPHLFDLSRKIEPFVEENIPYFAFNICVGGKKPE